MADTETPDIRQLLKEGNSRALLRLLGHPQKPARLGAAEALSNMELEPREAKRASKQIRGILGREKSKPALLEPDPVAIGVYEHSLLLLARPDPQDALFGVYKVWSRAYMAMLHQHIACHKGFFRLGSDADRARQAQIEQIAERVMTLGSQASEHTRIGSRQLDFIFATVEHLNRLIDEVGIGHLRDPEHLDWEKARALYQRLCKLLATVTGLEFDHDPKKCTKLADNLFQLLLQGEISADSPHLDAKALSAIAKRTDLPASGRGALAMLAGYPDD